MTEPPDPVGPSKKQLDEHNLKMRLAYFAMCLVSLGFMYLLILITLQCCGVIALPAYVIGPLATGTAGCGAGLLYKITKNLYPSDKSPNKGGREDVRS